MCQRCTRVLLNLCWVCWSGTEMFLTPIVFSAGNTVRDIEQPVSTFELPVDKAEKVLTHRGQSNFA